MIILRIEDVAPIEHLKDLAYTDLVPVLSDATELARVIRVAIGAEQRESEIRFTSVYQRVPQPIIHPGIRAVPGFTGREAELAALGRN